MPDVESGVLYCALNGINPHKATGTDSAFTQSLTHIVLPKPAGAETSIKQGTTCGQAFVRPPDELRALNPFGRDNGATQFGGDHPERRRRSPPPSKPLCAVGRPYAQN